MHKIIVAGAGTEVGKTVVSAILALIFKANYWKPIECGALPDSDTATMQQWLDVRHHTIYPSAYSFKAPLSPHHAARLEKRWIDKESIIVPSSPRALIIESVGGICVPLTLDSTTLEVFKKWNCQWIVVSKHYLGSINHTLMTLEILKQHQIPVRGVIFNGLQNPDSEAAILNLSQLPCLGNLRPEKKLNNLTFKKYVKAWKPQILKHFP